MRQPVRSVHTAWAVAHPAVPPHSAQQLRRRHTLRDAPHGLSRY